jgi:hypothetical protein
MTRTSLCQLLLTGDYTHNHQMPILYCFYRVDACSHLAPDSRVMLKTMDNFSRITKVTPNLKNLTPHVLY